MRNEAELLANAEVLGLTLVQDADGRWTMLGDSAPPPRFRTRQYALGWLANRIRAIESAKRRHPANARADRLAGAMARRHQAGVAD